MGGGEREGGGDIFVLRLQVISGQEHKSAIDGFVALDHTLPSLGEANWDGLPAQRG